MRNAIELNEEILDRISGGSHFKNQDYVQSMDNKFAGLGMISDRHIDENGNYVYSVWVIEENKIYNNILENDLKGL